MSICFLISIAFVSISSTDTRMHSVVRALVAGDQKYHLQSRSFCLEFAAIWYKRSCLTFCLFPAYEVSRIEILASGVVKSSRAQPSFRALFDACATASRLFVFDCESPYVRPHLPRPRMIMLDKPSSPSFQVFSSPPHLSIGPSSLEVPRVASSWRIASLSSLAI